jgi:hypothetical protein
MKSRIKISLFVIAAVLFGGSFILVRSVLTQSTQKSPGKISLRARAKRDGKAVTKLFPRLIRYDTLEALKKDSSVIILGTVTARASRVGPYSENAVSTDYTVKVEESFKGDFAKDNLVKLNEVGGKLVYEDGTYAEMVLPDYWKTPQLQKSYVLFLNPRKDAGDYRLVGGPQGLFEVNPSRVLKPQGLPTDELFRAHDGMSLKKFAERVRTNVEERAALRSRGANVR